MGVIVISSKYMIKLIGHYYHFLMMSWSSGNAGKIPNCSAPRILKAFRVGESCCDGTLVVDETLLLLGVYPHHNTAGSRERPGRDSVRVR
jgi:hypothetical protein